jgi:hypothetical protein
LHHDRRAALRRRRGYLRACAGGGRGHGHGRDRSIANTWCRRCCRCRCRCRGCRSRKWCRWRRRCRWRGGRRRGQHDA